MSQTSAMISIVVKCTDCNGPLTIREAPSVPTGADIQFQVDPCAWCMNEAAKEALTRAELKQEDEDP